MPIKTKRRLVGYVPQRDAIFISAFGGAIVLVCIPVDDQELFYNVNLYVRKEAHHITEISFRILLEAKFRVSIPVYTILKPQQLHLSSEFSKLPFIVEFVKWCVDEVNSELRQLTESLQQRFAPLRFSAPPIPDHEVTYNFPVRCRFEITAEGEKGRGMEIIGSVAGDIFFPRVLLKVIPPTEFSLPEDEEVREFLLSLSYLNSWSDRHGDILSYIEWYLTKPRASPYGEKWRKAVGEAITFYFEQYQGFRPMVEVSSEKVTFLPILHHLYSYIQPDSYPDTLVFSSDNPVPRAVVNSLSETSDDLQFLRLLTSYLFVFGTGRVENLSMYKAVLNLRNILSEKEGSSGCR